MKAFNKGVSGDSFADVMQVEPEDEQLYWFLHQMGKEGIMMAINASGALAQMPPETQLKMGTWLDDFLSYGAPEESQK